MKRFVRPAFFLVLIALLLSLLVLRTWPGAKETSQEVAGADATSFPTATPPLPADPRQSSASSGDENKESGVDKRGVFSPEMERLVQSIQAGKVVRVRVGDAERSYIFRPKRITAEGFQISVGPNAAYPAAFEIFEGRQVLSNGSLAHMAKLAVVNDTLSMAYTTEAGDFLIEQNEAGELVAKTLLSREEGSTWGHWRCAADGKIAGTAMVSTDSSPPPELAVEISLGAVAADGPEIAGARVDHPYFRLGPQYDASLKDIIVLMVSSKSQTGTSSNLSSRAASYFSYGATLADVYERQLGLRFMLQELILIPSDSSEPDIESPTISTDTATQQLNYVRDWAAAHRPQATYKWGHVMGWTLVDGVARGTVGWAWIGSYGSSSFGISVNEREYTWGVIAHELGHNVGANHTSGGVMNPTVSRSNPLEDFFRENSTSGGGFTAAKEVYDYMSNPSRAFVSGPAPLRNPNEKPFGVDDSLSTDAGTPISFNPLANDLAATPLFGQTNTDMSLVEVGQVFPKVAGSTSMSGNQITFTPTPGYTGNVWFSYTLKGNIGNGGSGWLHSADVVVTVGGSSTNPSLTPALSTTNDVVEADFTGDIRINPLLNDEGKGRLWAGGVDAVISVSGSAQSYSEGAFRLVSATVISGTGSITLETAEMTRNTLNAQSNTGYLRYTPGVNDLAQVIIEYTVADADGNQSTATITINRVDPRELLATGTVIGTNGSYLNNPAWDKFKVFDGDLTSFYDAANASGDWAGLDMGSPKQITRIKYAPRSPWPSRMVGGQFQGSNTADFSSGVVTFFTVPSAPPTGVLSQVMVNNTGTYRYVRYIGPTDGWCNVAEVEFYTEAAPAPPTGLAATVEANGHIRLDWNDNSEIDLASYNVYRSTTAATFGTTPIASPATSSYTDPTVANGTTYYYVVTAVDNEGYESTRSNQVSATPAVNQFAPEVNAGPDQVVVLIDGGDPVDPTSGAAIFLNAGLDDGANLIWEDSTGLWNVTLDANVTFVADAGSSLTGITSAYQFPGGLLGSGGGQGSSLRALGANNKPFSLEIWFKPNASDSYPANGQILWETGGSTGLGVFYNDGLVQTAHDGNQSRISADVSDLTGEFIQVVVTHNTAATSDNFNLYVNGTLMATASRNDTDLSGTDGAGLGRRGGGGVGGAGSGDSNTTSFDGQIALFRTYHDRVLSPAEISTNYDSVASGSSASVELNGTVSDPDGNELTTTWRLQSGPEAVTFADPSAVVTTATFTEPGTYVLRLTAFDGFFTSFDEVTITITEEDAFVDSNSNGIEDVWEMANFDRLLDADEMIHESGVAYYFMFLHGTDLDNPADRFRVAVEPDAQGDLVFSWEMREQFDLGIHYEIRISTNLTRWDPIPAEHYTLEQTPDGSRTRTKLNLSHDYGDRVFFRLIQP
jgi:hypothetical protein